MDEYADNSRGNSQMFAGSEGVVYANLVPKTSGSYEQQDQDANRELQRIVSNLTARENLGGLNVIPLCDKYQRGPCLLYYLHERPHDPVSPSELKVHMGSAFEISPWYNSPKDLRRVLKEEIEKAMLELSGHRIFHLSLKRNRAGYLEREDQDRFVFALAGEALSSEVHSQQEVEVVLHFPAESSGHPGALDLGQTFDMPENTLNHMIPSENNKRLVCFDSAYWWETWDMPLFHPCGVSVLIFEEAKPEEMVQQGFKSGQLFHDPITRGNLIEEERDSSENELQLNMRGRWNMTGKKVVDFSLSYERANIIFDNTMKYPLTRVDMLWEEDRSVKSGSQQWCLNYVLERSDHHNTNGLTDRLKNEALKSSSPSEGKIVASAIDYESGIWTEDADHELIPVLSIVESTPQAFNDLAPGLESQYDDEVISAAEDLVQMGAPKVSALGDALWEESPARRAVRDALVALGEPHMDEYLELLGEENWGLRRDACLVLGAMGEKAAPAVDALVTMIEDEWIRIVAVKALVQIGPPAVGALIDALGNESPEVAQAAVKALGGIAEPALEPLLLTLKEGNATLRKYVAQALGQMEEGPQAAVFGLLMLLGDEDPEVIEAAIEAAIEALMRIIQPAVPALLRSFLAESAPNGDPLQGLLDKIDGEKIAPLLEALADSDEALRCLVVQQILRVGEPLVEKFVAALEDVNRAAAATQILVKIGEPAVAGLVSIIEDKDLGQSAAATLVRIGEPAVEKLVPEIMYKDAATEVLVQMGEPAVEKLVDALRDADSFPRLRHELITILTRIGEPGVEKLIQMGPLAVERLVDGLWDENIRDALIETLVPIGEPAVEGLMARLPEPKPYGSWREMYPGNRVGISDALVRCGEPAVKALMQVLEDEGLELRLKAADLLGEIGEPASGCLPRMRTLLRRHKFSAFLGNRIAKEFVETLKATIKAIESEVQKK